MNVESKLALRVDRLRGLREQRGWSQRELARHCGFSDALVRRYEIGASDPTGHSLKVLAEQLGVSADYLLGMTDDPRGHYGDGKLNPDEQKLLDSYRREGLGGLVRFVGEQMAK